MPRRRLGSPLLHLSPPALYRLLERLSRIDVAFDDDADGASESRFACEDFRHGLLWEGEIFVEPDLDFASPATIEMRVTAANLTSDERVVISLPFTLEERKVEDLLDTSEMKLRKGVPHFAWLETLDKDEFEDRVDIGEGDT